VTESIGLGRRFGTVADLYDDVRPDYPAELYDAIERVAGAVSGEDVVDLAAGTGLQTRELLRRGARVVAVDPDLAMLRRLRSTVTGVPVVAGAGERIPLRDNTADLVVVATAWHWMHAAEAVAEVRRVLRPGGHLALWWANNRWGDGIDWEAAQSEVLERWDRVRGSVPLTIDGVGPRDAAADLRERGVPVMLETEFTWTREVTRDQHLRVLATHSNNLVLSEAERRELLAEIEAVLQPWPTLTERLWGPLIVAGF
jgi:SAM-dependent methyltransferase